MATTCIDHRRLAGGEGGSGGGKQVQEAADSRNLSVDRGSFGEGPMHQGLEECEAVACPHGWARTEICKEIECEVGLIRLIKYIYTCCLNQTVH